MNNYKIIKLLLIFVVFALKTNAQVLLPSFFSDGMILQQQTNAAIWGKASPRTMVKIVTSWDNASYEMKVKSDSTWKIKVKTPVAGGPFSIRITNNTEIILRDILIGEVWLASGQSNMEMPLKGFKDQPVKDSETIISEASNNNIRFFDVENVSWKKPLYNCRGSWKTSSPDTAPFFSATAYLFARNLFNLLQVPIGIIESDWGGTPVEAWMSEDEISAYPEIIVAKQKAEPNKDKKAPVGLYNGMIHPLVGYSMKGVIWYQGEQNRDNPELYAKLFPNMVKQWRSEWGIGNFPFYYAQIAPYLSKTTNLSAATKLIEPKVPFLREAQLKSEKKIKNSGMAVLMDVGDKKTIHPSDKQTVADRLFFLAKAKTYGKPETKFSGPVYSKMKVEQNKILLYFKYAEDGLQFKDGKSINFEIAAKNQVFFPATAEIKGSVIIVTSENVNHPVAVRYAYKAWAKGDLYNSAGLPASSFRTDNWKISTSK